MPDSHCDMTVAPSFVADDGGSVCFWRVTETGDMQTDIGRGEWMAEEAMRYAATLVAAVDQQRDWHTNGEAKGQGPKPDNWIEKPEQPIDPVHHDGIQDTSQGKAEPSGHEANLA